ncbi:putative r.meliloti pRmeGR4a plasmid DNA (plasmid) [Ochrobactrum quorumnocens]|uniref:Putative r.meliloti pRmeGR4a plasmid DNA n=1 Tax=Ochrobactrum quorumnocens TaxID=271865 RepID=A0A248UPC5_9HYPH|nr:putative r.meliloti pRmeGR4a plasmid DNA [[Ochrobactrum] quorumnocens]
MQGVPTPALPVMTHSAAIIEDLTAHKTAALPIELANNADIALVAVVHSMLIDVIYSCSGHSALQSRVTQERLERSMKDAELSVRAAKKKGEAVLIAERLVSGTGWLPVPVRIATEATAETMDYEIGEETGCADDEAEFPQAAE